MGHRARRSTRTVALAAALVMIGGAAGAGPGGATWSSAGGDLANTRNQAAETRISPTTVADLALDWVVTTGGDVSATPAVGGQRVYVPDWAGNLYAVDRATGAVAWTTTIADYTGLPGDKVRTTPAIAGDLLVFGNQGPFGGGGAVMAVEKDTGDLVWSTQASTHPAAIITQSATVHAGVVYVGVSSLEEAFAAFVPNYPCCSFQGSMLALDLATGEILWETTMAPDGFSGNAVWGSSPSVDVKRNQVYVATGNNYSVPQSVLDCVAAAGDDSEAKAECLPADNYFDAVVALDMDTGAVNWVTKALDFDAWTVDCLPFLGDGDNCPEPAGPDFDFGQAPQLFRAGTGKEKRELVGAGQKSGQYWAMDPDTGAVVWVTQAGPGGVAGGLQWGSAVDGTRVYTANANSDANPWLLPNGEETTDGVWSGLHAATGEVLWQTTPPNGGQASGPATTANGVVFSCTLDDAGHMYALDAATGDVLWSFASGGACLSGAAISRGSIYFGSGYTNIGGTGNDKLYAFSVPSPAHG